MTFTFLKMPPSTEEIVDVLLANIITLEMPKASPFYYRVLSVSLHEIQ